MNLSLKALLLSAVAVQAMSGVPTPASAQGAEGAPREPGRADENSVLGEVVVTARRRAENVQDVPSAVTALGGDQLAKQQIRTPSDLQYNVPSLNVLGRLSHQGATYAIRGLMGSYTGASSVGTYFAEVTTPTSPGNDPTGGQSLYDLESVQVLKGPQGTLFGRTSIAGAVLVTPRKPDLQTLSGRLQITEGTLGRQEVTGAINVPILPGKLAVRVAVNKSHLDGYTRIIGSEDRLDETNTSAYRATLEFRPVDWARSTTIYDAYYSSAKPAGFLLSAAYTGLPTLNPSAASFNAICATAVANGYAPNLSSCVSQRVQIFADIRAALASETARTAGGGESLREVPRAPGLNYLERSRHQRLINITEVDLPTVGAFETSIKNIFGFQKTRGLQCTTYVGLPQALDLSCGGASANSKVNQVGASAVATFGDGNEFWTNETQFQGRFDGDRLVWVAGYYVQNAPVIQQLDGVPTAVVQFGGARAVNLGWTPSQPFLQGGKTIQHAVYGQFTLDFAGLVEGLHFTAGGRRTSDRSTIASIVAVVNPVTGNFSPTGASSISQAEGKGTGYTFSLDYRVNPDILVYATTRKGYVPGGINTALNVQNIASFERVYGAEHIKDVELGVKWDYQFGDIRGRTNIAVYRQKYNDIQRNFSAINSVGTVVQYTGNAAAAKLQGLEIESYLEPRKDLRIGVNYALNDTKYTKWLAGDPLNIAPAGTILDLSNNPFPNAPRHKFSMNVEYDLPLDPDWGTFTVGANGSYVTRTWYASSPQRMLDLYEAFVPDLRDKTSQKPFAIFNARIDWDHVLGHENLRVSAFAKNLTDKIYATSGLVVLNTRGTAGKIYAEPRTFGLELAYRFGE